MVLAFPGPTDHTTDLVARDLFIEALEDPDLVIQVQAQRSARGGAGMVGEGGVGLRQNRFAFAVGEKDNARNCDQIKSPATSEGENHHSGDRY